MITRILFVALLAIPAGMLCAAEPVSDIRVLIDVSGSMKQNDPKNLRIPALKLLTGLLESGSQAGVWTFGQYVNLQVPLGSVDDAWRKKAEQGAKKLHSRGLFTNIEEAIRQAAFDWNEPDATADRHLILLTDGMVDVSKVAEESEASRARILDELLPKLRQAGAKVHTIALSENADRGLLERLSLGTDGRFELVETSDELNRVFLRMFESASQRDTLPLEDNGFSVDKSVQELTLLVFRSEDSEPTRVVDPRGVEFGFGETPDNVRWHHETGYDLITVEQPAAGHWKVLAKLDEDNRVLVVTNLRLKVSDLPTHINLGEEFDLQARLLQDGEVIQKKKFLDLVTITLVQEKGIQKRWSWQLKDNGLDGDEQAGDGVFRLPLAQTLESGEHQLVVEVDGYTFAREYRQRVTVHASPVEVKVTPGTDGALGGATVLVIPNEGLIQTDSMSLTLTLSGPGGQSQDFDIAKTDEGWALVVQGLTDPGEYQASVRVEGINLRGKPISQVLPPIRFDPFTGRTELPPPPVLPPSAQKAEALASAEPLAEPATVPPAEVAVEGLNPWVAGGGLLLANLLLFGGGFLVFRRLRRPSVDLELNLGED